MFLRSVNFVLIIHRKSLDSCTHVIACRKKSTSDKLVLTKERLLNQLGAIKKTINRPVQVCVFMITSVVISLYLIFSHYQIKLLNHCCS